MTHPSPGTPLQPSLRYPPDPGSWRVIALELSVRVLTTVGGVSLMRPKQTFFKKSLESCLVELLEGFYQPVCFVFSPRCLSEGRLFLSLTPKAYRQKPWTCYFSARQRDVCRSGLCIRQFDEDRVSPTNPKQTSHLSRISSQVPEVAWCPT